MRTTTTVCFTLWWLCGLSGCGQVGCVAAAPGAGAVGFRQEPEPVQDPAAAEPRRRGPEPRQGRPYAQTRARLLYFREDLEFDRFDVDFDGGTGGKLRNVDRDRFGFRAEFGRPASSGFFQLFAEKFRAPSLLLEQFDNYGLGGGVAGVPPVGDANGIEFVVPYRFEVDLVRGDETVAGFDEDLYYLEGIFELGFGARRFGVQACSGVLVQTLAGRFDSDNPASPANSDAALVRGTNVGGYLELLYKNDRVPLTARVRGVVGDVSGLEFSFGFAF